MARASTLGAAASRGGPPRASLLSDRALVLLREARWLLLCTLALFVALILLSYDRADPGWSHAAAVRDIHNLGGRVGAWIADLLLYLFGVSAYLWAAFLLLRVVSGYRLLHQRRVAGRREALGVRAGYHGADMSKPAEIRAMMAFAAECFGAVDILVNNAGIQFVSPVESFPEDRWDAIIAINLCSSFHTIKAALPAMKPGRVHHGGTTATSSGAPAPIASTASAACFKYQSQLTEDWCGAMISRPMRRAPAACSAVRPSRVQGRQWRKPSSSGICRPRRASSAARASAWRRVRSLKGLNPPAVAW